MVLVDLDELGEMRSIAHPSIVQSVARATDYQSISDSRVCYLAYPTAYDVVCGQIRSDIVVSLRIYPQ